MDSSRLIWFQVGTCLYTSVVSFRGFEIRTKDDGNTYLEDYTQEKLYIERPEFGCWEGRSLINRQERSGLKSSWLLRCEKCSKILLCIGFTPSEAEDYSFGIVYKQASNSFSDTWEVEDGTQAEIEWYFTHILSTMGRFLRCKKSILSVTIFGA